jgi:hypothetical protein
MTTAGRCFCGQTRWSFEGAMTWACFCHCDACRRTCGAPVVGWFGVPAARFTWTGEPPRTYENAKGVRRHFCATCGSPMGYEADHYPGGMHLYAATLDDPATFRPTFHVNYENKLPWLTIDDDLPKYEGTLLTSPEDPKGYGSA